MSQTEKRVLILEDDESLGLAIGKFLEKHAIAHDLFSKPDEAMQSLGKNLYSHLIIDCLLPQMTGVDFIQRVKSQFPHQKFSTILMSGIYTDKEFIQEAISKTKADMFLKKPFNLEKILDIFDKQAEQVIIKNKPEVNLLYSLFHEKNKSTDLKRNIFMACHDSHGLDLIYILELIVSTKTSGYLSILRHGREFGQIGFSEGIIFSVDVQSRTPQLGELLIQKGYVDPNEALIEIEKKTDEKLGKRLIDQCLLSPHLFEEALRDQLSTRISLLILDDKVQFLFTQADLDAQGAVLDLNYIDALISDLILIKGNESWLKSVLNQFLNKTMTISSLNSLEGFFKHSCLSYFEGLKEMLAQPKVTIRYLLECFPEHHTEVLKAIYFLSLKEVIIFDEIMVQIDPKEQLNLLLKIEKEVKNKNPYQLIEYLGYKLDEAIDYNSFQKSVLNVLGKQPETQTEVKSIWIKIYSMFEKSGELIKKGNLKGSLHESMRHEEAESKLKLTQLIEEVKKFLSMNQYAKAQVMLAEIAKINTTTPNYHLFNAWAKLGNLDLTKKQLQLKEVEIELTQVAQEERYDAQYSFVVGFFNKQKGDYVQAKKSFERSIALDSSFMPARRELTSLNAKTQQQTDVFSTVMTGLFKRK